MLVRAAGIAAVLATGLVPSCEPSCAPPPQPGPRPTDEVVALVVDGLDSPWRRVIDADLVESRYGLGSLQAVSDEGDQVRLTGTAGEQVVTSAELDAAYGLPSSAFDTRGVARRRSVDAGFTFIGDSLGVSITEGGTDELPALLDGVFWNPRYDAVGSRCTADPGCRSTGLAAAQAVPAGTAMVVVELGINDASGDFATKIDQVMGVLADKGVGTVVWLTISTRSTYAAGWASANNEMLVDAATGRWSGRLHLLDWNAASTGADKDHWFASDRVHLTATGQAHMAVLIRDAVIDQTSP
jgi:hypothetical protein